MPEKKTVEVSSSPEFLEELSEYLEVLSQPVRLKILKFIEHEPREMTAVAAFTGMSYQNTKKHMDRLMSIGLVIRDAGFGRETDRGIAPVWKYSLAHGSLECLTRTLGIFSSIPAPSGYTDIRTHIHAVRTALAESGSELSPVLYLINGPAQGSTFVLTDDRIEVGREDPAHPAAGSENAVILPDAYLAVTRIKRGHAVISRSMDSWQIEDNGSTGGTYLNSARLTPLQRVPLSHGDTIDLSLGQDSARFLFISDL